ncbi:S8 family serine peptidase [Szabonella alba]|uniref:S8 family serine peptidase n=1 Tax=Szabonella alba TaxID=2804194 RepID=A0A8K0VBF6_9RHOB|nr:S8 family serine peptidase [Szabonella alba]MBL4916090.1 S8 family serine peptidase [Szabonella alba]
MTPDDPARPDPLAPAESAYLHWAAELARDREDHLSGDNAQEEDGRDAGGRGDNTRRADGRGRSAGQRRAGTATGPAQTGPGPLQSALVRLCPSQPGDRPGDWSGDRPDARAALIRAMAEGAVFLDPEDAAEIARETAEQARATPTDRATSPADEPFTVYWSDFGLAEFQRRFAGVLEVLHPCRPITRGAEPLTLCPPPDCGCAQRPAAPIVAVIDDGIGFLNRRFCRRDSRDGGAAAYRTRFHAIWLQAFRSVPAPAFGAAYRQTGEVLHRPEIDALLARGAALDEGAVYRALNLQLYGPGAHRATEQGFSHGTHVLDLAAGADPDRNDPAGDWPLLAVQLPPEAVDNTAGTQLEPCIVAGVRWILQQALRINRDSPVVINISFATFAGPKDGSKAIEALIARMAADWQARHGRRVRVVYAWGNARLANQGAHLTLAPGHDEAITWRLQPDDFAASYLEVRPDDPADLSRLALHLTAPGPGARPVDLGGVPANSSRAIRDVSGRLVGRFYHLGARSSAPGVVTPAHAVLAMAPTEAERGLIRTPAGGWTIGLGILRGGPLPLRLEVQRGDTPNGYRTNGRQSYLDHPRAHDWDPESADWTAPGSDCPITRGASHSSFVTARSDCVHAVAAAVDLTDLPPAPYSATGSARTRAAPTLSAPGDRGTALTGLVAAGTFSGSGRVANGTSVAAARVSRVIATALDNGTFPEQPGAAEAAALVALYGEAADPHWQDRQGAGILTGTGIPVPALV